MSGAAWWSIITAVVSTVGLPLGGWQPKAGWWWGFISQTVWIIEGLYTGRPGDIGLSLVFIAMYVINLRRSRRALWIRPRRGQTRLEALAAAYTTECHRQGAAVPPLTPPVDQPAPA